MDCELFVLDRLAQITLELEPFRGQFVHVGRKELVVRATRSLCFVQRGTRILQQRLAILAIEKKQAHTDTRGRKELMTRQIERKLQDLRQRSNRLDHVFRAVDLRAQQRKLIAAEARDRV